LIHQYINNGYHIVLDICSGSIHHVDEVAYAVIGWLQEHGMITIQQLKQPQTAEELEKQLGASYPISELAAVLAEVTFLCERGQLFTPDTYEEYIDEIKKRETVVKALCLHVAHDCNLACRYCFAKEGEYKGERGLMSPAVGKKAIDFLIANSGNRRNLEVDFFGGEPLMNRAVVKEIVAYGRSREQIHQKNLRFTLTTNGVSLNEEMQEFVNREMDNLVLSLDGRKELNDYLRPFPSGKGSYDFIVPKLQKMVESRDHKKYYIRGTFTRKNLDFSKDVLHMHELGFRHISIEPVVGKEQDDYAIREEDLPRIFQEYDTLAKEMVERQKRGEGFTFFHFMIDLAGGPCVAKRLSGCGAGTEYLAVTPWGDLYPCHQFVGNEEFKLGDVEKGIDALHLVKDFKSCSVYSKSQCEDCFARFYCSGGCMANAWEFEQSIHGIYPIGCEMEKKRVECAIMMQVAKVTN